MLWLNSFKRRLKLKRRKPYAIFPLIVILLFISIGYAYLNTTLSINGTSMLDSARWDVHFENIQVKNGSVTPTVEPTITDNTTVAFSVTLENPGDYYEFNIDVVNDGTLDAMIGSFSITPVLTENQQKYFDYIVTFADGCAIAENYQINAGDSETLRIAFIYKTTNDTNDYPTTDDNNPIEITINYIQKTENGIPHLPSFKLSCTGNNAYHFNEGMTFGDWIKSDLYNGNISGDFDSLQDCISVWGNDKGCAAVNNQTIYSYIIYISTEYDEEQGNHDSCTVVNNTVYRLKYTDLDFDTIEECEDYYEEDVCELYNNKYVNFAKEYYGSQSECEEEGSYYNIAYCELLPTAYQCSDNYYSNFDTQAECEADYLDYLSEEYAVDYGGCSSRTIQHYNSPTYRKGTMAGEFDFNSAGALLLTSDGKYEHFFYDQVLTNTTYTCSDVAECVSPESDILSSNNKTIKAKSIKENDNIAYYDFSDNQIKIGKANKVYIHKDATDFVKYLFSDGSYIEVTNYHPIYTSTGWKSYTNRNGYPKPIIGDLVKTESGYKRLVNIIIFTGKEDYYDFQIIGKNGKIIDNYYANGTLVQGSYN